MTALPLAAVGGSWWQTGVAPKIISLKSFSNDNAASIMETYFRQIIFSQLYLEARALSEGSIRPPRRRRTR